MLLKHPLLFDILKLVTDLKNKQIFASYNAESEFLLINCVLIYRLVRLLLESGADINLGDDFMNVWQTSQEKKMNSLHGTCFQIFI